MVTKCTSGKSSLSACRKRPVEADFEGGHVSSNGGAVLLRQVDRRLGLTAAVARKLDDTRQPGKVRHRLQDMVRQRSYAIALGHEDPNDHDQLRHDLAMQTAAERDSPLASAPTLCRFENQATPDRARSMHEVLVQTFLAAHPTPPEEIVPDIDATDDVVHGHQVGSFFHGYYDHYCFLPLYVFAGNHLLVAWLRPANVDGARHAGAIMKLLITRLCQEWPETRFVIRADSGFCRRRLMSWCDRNSVDYIIGLPGNPRLTRLVAPETAEAERAFTASGRKQFHFTERLYGAESWNRKRRVIARIRHGPKGARPRFIVTSLKGECEALCRKVWCQRGEMENRIKEKQLQLFADRTSCHEWWPNRFRLLLAGLACTLINEIRRIALAGTRMARAQCATIRPKLLKIGAVITRNTRRIRFHLSGACPDQDLFRLAVARLKPG